MLALLEIGFTEVNIRDLETILEDRSTAVNCRQMIDIIEQQERALA